MPMPTEATTNREELMSYFKLMYTMRRMEITCDTEYKVNLSSNVMFQVGNRLVPHMAIREWRSACVHGLFKYQTGMAGDARCM